MGMNALGPFLSHGISFTHIPERGGEATADACPFCGKEKHFRVDTETGQWGCFKCQTKGNIPTFLEEYLALHLDTTTKADWRRLSKVRKGSAPYTAYKRACFAWTGEHWIFPVRTIRGTIQDLRKYVEPAPGKKNKIYGTKECKTGLWGAELLEGSTGTVWICEGEWDAVALNELFRKLGLSDIAVAVPGADVFKKEWLTLFNNRDVVLAYDADKTGDAGMHKVGFGELGASPPTRGLLQNKARSIQYVRWPLDIPDKYDISDLLREAESPEAAWDRLQSLVDDAPRTEALPNVRKKIKKRKQKKQVAAVTFAEVVEKYRKWLDLNEDSVAALRVVFAVVLSNQMPGDPLWLYLVAPPGSGKTALIYPLRALPDRCVFRSSLTKFELVSGFQGSTDPSLIPKLEGKTLVLKDMTEILAAPQHVQEEVFGVLRGAYDGLVERSYGNGVFRRYELKFSLVAGVTVQIHGHSRASMGERMVKFQLVPYGNTNHEEKIRAAIGNSGLEDEMDEDLCEVTVDFLDRDIDHKALTASIPKWVTERIVALSQIIAKLRSEVERDARGDQVKYRPQEEVATRIAKQLYKLSVMLVPTSATGSFTEEDWAIVERTAFDTAIGWNLDVVQAMMQVGQGQNPITRQELVEASGLPQTNVTRRLEDLLLLGVVKKTVDRNSASSARIPTVYYQLDPKIRQLWLQAGVVHNHVGRVLDIRRANSSQKKKVLLKRRRVKV